MSKNNLILGLILASNAIFWAWLFWLFLLAGLGMMNSYPAGDPMTEARELAKLRAIEDKVVRLTQ